MIERYIQKPRIVASLTTIPSRLEYIDETIKSLCDQSMSLDKIYLHVPKVSRKGKTYNENLLDIYRKKYEKLCINRCDEDYGPITKIVPIIDMEKDPDTFVFCCDDDTIYLSNIVEKLYNSINKYKDAVVGIAGLCIGKFPFYIQFIANNDKDLQVDWLQGVDGVMYKIGQLDKYEMIKLKSDEPKEFIFNDDHKISLYLERKGIKRISVAGHIKHYVKYRSNNTIDALSGRPLENLKEWRNILSYMSKNNYYYQNQSIINSVFFYIIVFLILLIVILYGYFTEYFYILLFFTIIIIIILLIYIKSMKP